jgi:16S rRNA C1402 N4-methylase RsmH
MFSIQTANCQQALFPTLNSFVHIFQRQKENAAKLIFQGLKIIKNNEIYRTHGAVLIH